ncbi:metallophosphoesterase family protein [Lactobacillus equicursoris]|uniref:metallophosphoesterase family protein n=1 Tax=Lactobacillus equicursoris TaxID=420645 RepID=UPI00242D4EA3|nr:DNA repair exonuclease [Lactobacillus equicursoris]MDD6387147.1 DNA repair exonuclease [Lactobacillus equicursoris]
MKFIHLADAHLDSPFRGLSFLPKSEYQEIKDAANESFTRIIDLAVREAVDLVLIAGDTFDSNKPSPASQVFFKKEIDRLTAAGIQVVMIFGNHDYMRKSDLLVKEGPHFILLGDGEQIERKDFTTKSGFAYNVTGFSYAHNHIEEDLLMQFPEKAPSFTIGLMHAGQAAGQNNVYAPFTLERMRELGYDYFALGHIHARQTLLAKPLVVYPGNIQGRDIGELGAKGCYLVEVDEESRQSQLTFCPTSQIVWEQANLVLDAPLSASDLADKIAATLRAHESAGVKTFVSLKLTGSEYLTPDQLTFWQDPAAWEEASSRANSARLVDFRVKVRGLVQLSSTDQAALDRAKVEILSEEKIKQLAASWIKKDPEARRLAENPEFLAQVKELVSVKLADRLQDIGGSGE